MNDSQQVATFILNKINQAPMVGEEAEAVTSAKQWLALIANGNLIVTQGEKREEPTIPDNAAANNGDGRGIEAATGADAESNAGTSSVTGPDTRPDSGPKTGS